MADEAVHRQTKDGRLGMCVNELDAIDCGSNGLAVLWAYKATGHDKYKTAFDKMVGWFLNAPKSSAGIVYHNIGLKKTMIDGIYHMAPMMAAAGYGSFAVEQTKLFRSVHMDTDTKLYSQYWDDEKQVFERADFWGPGMGWMLASLPLTAYYLNADQNKERQLLKEYMIELSDACISYMRPDGLFHDIMDDKSSFVQTSTGIMLAYGIYRAIQFGLLDAGYRRYADTMYEASVEHVDEDGYLQNACASPTFDYPGVSAESQAFLLMCVAARKVLESGDAIYP
jgi:rhamnogalacturonyl hydrolase YesR